MKRFNRKRFARGHGNTLGSLHITETLREGDPVVWSCETCAGILVERPDEEHPRCPKCGAEPCAGCHARRLAMVN